MTVDDVVVGCCLVSSDGSVYGVGFWEYNDKFIYNFNHKVLIFFLLFLFCSFFVINFIDLTP